MADRKALFTVSHKDDDGRWHCRMIDPWGDDGPDAPPSQDEVKDLILSLHTKVDTLMATMAEAITAAQAALARDEASDAVVVGLMTSLSANVKDLAAQLAAAVANGTDPAQAAAVQAIADQLTADANQMDAIAAAQSNPPVPEPAPVTV